MKQLLILFIVLLSISVAKAEIDPGDNQLLPDIRWSDDQGQQHHLAAIKDKAKILHFWAAWCIPCRKEMPHLIEWRKQNADIEVLALSLDDRMAQTKNFIKKFELDMPPLRINEDDSEALGVPIVPYTIFVSSDNRFVGFYAGPAPWQEQAFTTQVRELLLNK